MPRSDSLRGLLGSLSGVLESFGNVLDAVDTLDFEDLAGGFNVDGFGAQGPAAVERRQACEVLGLDPDVEHDEATIRRAFKQAARGAHPDAPNGSDAAFERVVQSRDVLLDVEAVRGGLNT